MSAKPKIHEPEATKARLSEGRQWIGIKNIEILPEVQPRAGINDKWVQDLHGYLKEGTIFPPADIFQLPNGGLIQATGHHRRYAHQNNGDADMLCNVINGTLEESIVHAAGSNKGRGPLPMGPKDISKAIRMLLAIPAWWNKSDKIIASKIGCGYAKAQSTRRLYAKELGISPPERVESSDGNKVLTTRWNPEADGYPSIRKHGPGFFCNAMGTHVYAATTEEVKAKVDRLVNGWKSKRKSLSTHALSMRLKKVGFKWMGVGRYGGLLGGWHGHGMVCIQCDIKDGESAMIAAANLKLLLCVGGRLIAGRQASRHSTRSVIITYREYIFPKIVSIFEEAGYEFMTPDELIASLGPVVPDETKGEE